MSSFRKDFDENNRVIKQEYINHKGKDYMISTVDLGIDHGFGDVTGIYWETMIFPKGEWLDLYCDRYSSVEEAKLGHEKAKQLLLNDELEEK